MPDRIQLRRTCGWRKPEGAVAVARPTRWGNPFTIGDVVFDQDTGARITYTRERCVALFETALRAGRMSQYTARPFTVDDVRRELAGRDLACWCRLDQPCHADVLLAIANEEPADAR